MKRILLMGNPNVGKSVVFSRLTGVHVVSSNYPGTTVGYTQGRMRLNGNDVLLIDVPGTYTLNPTCKAEEIALEMLQEADAVINVVDATNLERNLPLTLHLLEKDVPLVVALNVWDDALHKGISINLPRLEKELGIPIVPTIAVTGEGMKELLARIPAGAHAVATPRSNEERWHEVGRIISLAQTITHRHHTWLETLGDASVTPLTGLPIAALTLLAAFFCIRLIGESLIGYVLEPGFNTFWKPVLTAISHRLTDGGFLHTLLIGSLINGEIDFIQSFGILSTGLFVGLGMVFPYVLAFYLVLGFLEDLGYLPRLAVLLDTLMHRLGMHGWAVIPMLLGFGCNVPGILATRVLENNRERLIACSLVAIAVPCASLQAMMWAILGPFGTRYIIIVYGALFLAWLIIGRILNTLLQGESPELILEIPAYRLPPASVVFRKLWMRVKSYFIDAVPFVMLGVLAVDLLQYMNVFKAISTITAPIFTHLLGLPKEASLPVLVGIFRKDVAVGMLSVLHLSPGQLVISVTVLAMSFPCIATFVVLARELGIIGMLRATALMIIAALTTGTLLHIILF